MALVLHGPVQSALVSAALALSQSDLTPGDRAKIRTNIDEALAHIDSDHVRSPNLDLVLAEVSKVWEFSCEINSHVDPRLRAQLEIDPDLRVCLGEIIREGVSNAIRHGAATHITIDISHHDEKIVRISIVDNGSGLPAAVIPGIGSGILEELTLDWTRVSDSSATTLTADILLA